MRMARGRILPLLFALGLALLVGACSVVDFSKFSNDAVAVQVSMSDFVGNSIDGAKVELFGDTDYDPVYSGSNGMASLGQVVPGNYTLHVLYPDGQFFERSVPVWGGNDILIEIEPTHIPIRLVINGQTNPGLNIELNGYGEDPAIEQANIGYNEAGRSFTLDFTIPAGAAGVYRLEGDIAKPDDNGSSEYFINGRSLGVATPPRTGGWQTYWYSSLFPEIELGEGQHTLRVLMEAGGQNIHSFRLVPVKLYN